MSGRIGFALALALLVGPALSSRAVAFPVVPFDLSASNVIVAESDRMIATYLGHSASYSNDLYLMLDQFGNIGDDGILSNDLLVFNNHSSEVGSTFEFDRFTAGTEMMFRLYVNDTGYNYYSSSASRNPDGKEHAIVEYNWMDNYARVSFEDLYGTPENDAGYNDLSFSFSGGWGKSGGKKVGEAPEPTTASLLLVGLFGMVALGRRKTR